MSALMVQRKRAAERQRACTDPCRVKGRLLTHHHFWVPHLLRPPGILELELLGQVAIDPADDLRKGCAIHPGAGGVFVASAKFPHSIFQRRLGRVGSQSARRAHGEGVDETAQDVLARFDSTLTGERSESQARLQRIVECQKVGSSSSSLAIHSRNILTIRL